MLCGYWFLAILAKRSATTGRKMMYRVCNIALGVAMFGLECVRLRPDGNG